jgi:hypothetical protein
MLQRPIDNFQAYPTRPRTRVSPSTRNHGLVAIVQWRNSAAKWLTLTRLTTPRIGATLWLKTNCLRFLSKKSGRQLWTPKSGDKVLCSSKLGSPRGNDGALRWRMPLWLAIPLTLTPLAGDTSVVRDRESFGVNRFKADPTIVKEKLT